MGQPTRRILQITAAASRWRVALLDPAAPGRPCLEAVAAWALVEDEAGTRSVWPMTGRLDAATLSLCGEDGRRVVGVAGPNATPAELARAFRRARGEAEVPGEDAACDGPPDGAFRLRHG